MGETTAMIDSWLQRIEFFEDTTTDFATLSDQRAISDTRNDTEFLAPPRTAGSIRLPPILSPSKSSIWKSTA